MQQAWAQQGATPMVMDAGDVHKYLQDDIVKWAKVIRSANIKAD